MEQELIVKVLVIISFIIIISGDNKKINDK